MFGPSCVLCQERRALALALGQTEAAGAAARQGAALPPRNAWEHYALGRAYLQDWALGSAGQELDRARQADPQGLWPNFYSGVCAYRLARYDDAVIDFTVCVTLAPQSATCFYNRGRAYAELGRLDRAAEDYGGALRLEPSLAAAALGRADIRRRQQQYDDALADLDLALRAGADGAAVAYQQALVHVARQDKAAAVASLSAALRLDPRHAEARELLDRLQPPR
jgi:tetratricopeptide (TPR) repeat protein